MLLPNFFFIFKSLVAKMVSNSPKLGLPIHIQKNVFEVL